MKKIIFTLSILLPSIIKAEGIDKKIDNAFQPISDFFSQLIFFEVFGYKNYFSTYMNIFDLTQWDIVNLGVW